MRHPPRELSVKMVQPQAASPSTEALSEMAVKCSAEVCAYKLTHTHAHVCMHAHL